MKRDIFMWIHKRKRLRDNYYRSFFTLIVIPILAVILISAVIIRTLLEDSSTRTILRAQDNLVSVLGNEVQDISLRLSHFVYVNDNEIVRTAAKTDTEKVSERYHYTRLLTESFNYAMVPIQDILSVVFYMKDGRSTYLKDDVILDDEGIKGAGWYQEALDDKNMVKIGYYDTGVTTSRRSAHTFTIAAGLAPDIDVDRDGVIEVVSLFVSSKVGNLMKDYNKDPLMGTTLLLDKNGAILLDIEENGEEFLPGQEGWMKERRFRRRVQGRDYVYLTTQDPVTECWFVTAVPAKALTRRFGEAAAAIVAVTLLLFFLFYRFSAYFLKNIVSPVHHVVEGMKQVEEGSLEVHVEPSGQEELRTMVHSFNRMVRRLKTLIAENEEHQQKKHEAEILALQSQINPHFLVNSLSSIRFIAQVSHYDAIAKMAEALMKILSCSFRSNAGFYTFREELEVLDSFLYLMKIRYSDGFDISYEVEDACMDCLVPRLILQPIVENSIVHGFSEMEDIGHIRLAAKVEQGFLAVSVEDNGKGMTDEKARQALTRKAEEGRRSIGIFNVNTRLILNFGEGSALAVESREGEGTRITFRIPVTKKEEKEEHETSADRG